MIMTWWYIRCILWNKTNLDFKPVQLAANLFSAARLYACIISPVPCQTPHMRQQIKLMDNYFKWQRFQDNQKMRIFNIEVYGVKTFLRAKILRPYVSNDEWLRLSSCFFKWKQSLFLVKTHSSTYLELFLALWHARALCMHLWLQKCCDKI